MVQEDSRASSRIHQTVWGGVTATPRFGDYRETARYIVVSKIDKVIARDNRTVL